MVKPAKDWDGMKLGIRRRGSRSWMRNRGVAIQAHVWPLWMVIFVDKLLDQPVAVLLVDRNHMIQKLPA